MENIIRRIELVKSSPIAKVISERIKEFEETGKSKEESVFSELCFCLLTANFQAEKCIRIQQEAGRDFLHLPEKELAQKLKKAGHRFWPQRANRIVEARECRTELCSLVMKQSGRKMREWLVKNIKGLGMKESSHFLRNIGYKDVAIIDFHIIDLLEKEKLVNCTYKKSEIPNRAISMQESHSANIIGDHSRQNKKITLSSKTITPKKYLEIEKILENLGKKVNLNLAELDLYLWYIETGKVLK